MIPLRCWDIFVKRRLNSHFVNDKLKLQIESREKSGTVEKFSDFLGDDQENWLVSKMFQINSLHNDRISRRKFIAFWTKH